MRALLMRLYQRSRADRWSSLFGQVAVYSFAVTAITGVFLLFYYKPGMSQVSYQGSYRKLDGVPMSQAYQSTLDISFDVRGGLLMRQMHHWAALLFIAAVCAHLLRLYFTGAFRRPLWLNWLIWVTLLVLGMVAGLSGTILPDDLLSGGSLDVLEGVTLSVPVIGTHLMVWIFGGDFPGHDIIARAYWLHVAVLPAVMIALLALLARRSRAVITPVSVIMFWFTCATIALLGTFAQVNPVWLFGPNQPGSISAGSVPGWYMGFLDGALRIMPAWRSASSVTRSASRCWCPGSWCPAPSSPSWPSIRCSTAGSPATRPTTASWTARATPRKIATAFGARRDHPSTGCCGRRRPTTRSPITSGSPSTRSPGSSGWRRWPPRSWRTRSPSGCASAWPGANGTGPSTGVRPAGS